MTNPRRRRGGEVGGGNDINANHSGSNSANAGTPRRGRYIPTRPTPESRCWCLTRVGVVLTVISGLILVVFFYPFFLHDDGLDDEDRVGLALLEELLGEEGNETASRILKVIVDVSNDLMLFELQLKAFLYGERVATLIKEHLQPVQDRVTSLTTQTSQYEKMDHIPGGPTHFITTSLHELEAIEDNQLARLDEQVQRIIAEETTLAVGMGETVLKLYNKATFVEQAVNHPLILEEGITISIDYLDDEETEAALLLLPKYPLHEVLPILSKLADKLELKEMAHAELQEIRESLGLPDFDLEGLMAFSEEEENLMAEIPELSTMVEVLEYRMSEVEEFIDENEVPLYLVQPLHSELMSRISTLQQDLLNYATNKRRAYLILRHTLQEDIRKLKVRIQNLRYKYAKIAS